MIEGNVFVRMFRLSMVGDVYKGHTHTFDHITLLAMGRVLCIREGITIGFDAPCLIKTKAGVHHEFRALSDDCVLCCVHAIRNGDGLDDIAPQEITNDEARELMARYPMIKLEAEHA